MKNITLTEIELKIILEDNLKKCLKKLNIDCTMNHDSFEEVINQSLNSAFERNQNTLANYFSAKLGETLNKNIVTGERLYTEVYERAYELEIININNTEVTIEVASHDKVPSGYL